MLLHELKTGISSAKQSDEKFLSDLAKETGADIDTLRLFMTISDPKNVHLCSADAARKAFAGAQERYKAQELMLNMAAVAATFFFDGSIVA